MPTFMPKFLVYSCLCCAHLYCTHWFWLYNCLSSLTTWSIASIQGTPHTHTRHTTHHTHRVKCWARVPRQKIDTVNVILFKWLSQQPTGTLAFTFKDCNHNLYFISLSTSFNDFFFIPPPQCFVWCTKFFWRLPLWTYLLAPCQKIRFEVFVMRSSSKMWLCLCCLVKRG